MPFTYDKKLQLNQLFQNKINLLQIKKITIYYMKLMIVMIFMLKMIEN